MEHHAGIDVSLELSSVCVVDARVKIVREAKIAWRGHAGSRSPPRVYRLAAVAGRSVARSKKNGFSPAQAEAPRDLPQFPSAVAKAALHVACVGGRTLEFGASCSLLFRSLRFGTAWD